MPKKRFTTAFIDKVKVEKRTEFFDEVKSGLGLRVTPAGSKTFFYRYRFNYRNKRFTIGCYSTSITLKVARAKTDELRVQVQKGDDPQAELIAKRNEAPLTFKEVIDSYKEKHFPNLKASTRSDYEHRLKHLIKGEGKKSTKTRGLNGKRPIKDISRYEIIDFLDGIAIKAPTQAQRIQAILSGIFKFAKDREWVEANIASEINIAKKRKPKGNKRKNVAFDDDQIKKLWNAFDQQIEPNRSYFKILMILGQRAGETRIMKWKSLNLEKNIWVIPETDTKNGLEHYVPLPQVVIDIIEKLKPLTSGSDYVFESPVKKGKPVGHAQKTAQRIRKNYSIPVFNIHSLRTTVATRLAGLGVTQQVLSKVLNHKRPGEGSIITAIYNKYDYEAEKKQALNLWNQQLQKITEGKSETPI